MKQNETTSEQKWLCDLIELGKSIENEYQCIKNYRIEMGEFLFPPKKQGIFFLIASILFSVICSVIGTAFLAALVGGLILAGIGLFCIYKGFDFPYQVFYVLGAIVIIIMVLMVISGVGIEIQNYKNYRRELKEYKIKKARSQSLIPILTPKLNEARNRVQRLSDNFQCKCDDFEVPERCRDIKILEKILSDYNEYYPDKTLKDLFIHYDNIEEQEEEFRQMMREEQFEIEKEREKELENEMREMREAAQQKTEPEFFDEYYDRYGNRLHYKGTDIFGNKVMEDENGNDIDVTTAFNGRLRRKDNNEYVDKL